MKQNDIAIIIVVVFVSCVVSYILSGKIFTTPAARQQQVEVAPSISANFGQPDHKYFNGNSLDPTLFIRIGNNANSSPFITKQGN